METEYTKKEKDAIDNAWKALAYRCDCSGNKFKLLESLKYERKQRLSKLVAKVLILREVAFFYRKNPNAKDLVGISQGILIGALAGLDAICITESYTGWMPCTVPELLDLIDTAGLHHSAYITRMVENVGKDIQ